MFKKYFIYKIYKTVYSISATLHSLSTWWHPNIKEESFALELGNSPYYSREMVLDFGQLCTTILHYSHEDCVEIYKIICV